MRALLYLIVTGFLIGLTTNLTKVALDRGVSPLAFLAWPVLGGAMLLTVWTRRNNEPARIARRPFVEYSLIAGLLTIAAPQLMLFASVPHVGAAFVVLSLTFPPLYTYLGALLLRMERFDAPRALGVVLALSGAAILAVFQLREPRGSALWVTLTLLAPVVLAAGNLYRTLRWPEGASPESLAPPMLGAGGVLVVLFGIVMAAIGDETGIFALGVPTEPRIVLVLLVAQAMTFAASYRFFFLLQDAGGPVYLSLIGSVAAVTGIPVAVLLLGETVPRGLLPAGLLIAIGVALLTLRTSKR